MKKLALLFVSWILCILAIVSTWGTLSTIRIDQLDLGAWLLGIALLNWIGINAILTYFTLFGLPDFVDGSN
jgi:hypothetical protein